MSAGEDALDAGEGVAEAGGLGRQGVAFVAGGGELRGADHPRHRRLFAGERRDQLGGVGGAQLDHLGADGAELGLEQLFAEEGAVPLLADLGQLAHAQAERRVLHLLAEEPRRERRRLFALCAGLGAGVVELRGEHGGALLRDGRRSSAPARRPSASACAASVSCSLASTSPTRASIWPTISSAPADSARARSRRPSASLISVCMSAILRYRPASSSPRAVGVWGRSPRRWGARDEGGERSEARTEAGTASRGAEGGGCDVGSPPSRLWSGLLLRGGRWSSVTLPWNLPLPTAIAPPASASRMRPA